MSKLTNVDLATVSQDVTLYHWVSSSQHFEDDVTFQKT